MGCWYELPVIGEKDIEKLEIDSSSHHTFCCGLVYFKYILTPFISPGMDMLAYTSPLRFQCPERKSFLDRHLSVTKEFVEGWI